MVCGGDVFCLDGECDKAQSGQSNDFAEAVSQLAALAAAGKDVAALNGVDVRAFTGQAKFCKKAAAGYSNCCKDSGWGQDIGLAKCSSDEKALATLYALAAGFLVTFFSVPNVRINIRKYRDIPAEMSYAPGEHIKGGQE